MDCFVHPVEAGTFYSGIYGFGKEKSLKKRSDMARCEFLLILLIDPNLAKLCFEKDQRQEDQCLLSRSEIVR